MLPLLGSDLAAFRTVIHSLFTNQSKMSNDENRCYQEKCTSPAATGELAEQFSVHCTVFALKSSNSPISALTFISERCLFNQAPLISGSIDHCQYMENLFLLMSVSLWHGQQRPELGGLNLAPSNYLKGVCRMRLGGLRVVDMSKKNPISHLLPDSQDFYFLFSGL